MMCNRAVSIPLDVLLFYPAIKRSFNIIECRRHRKRLRLRFFKKFTINKFLDRNRNFLRLECLIFYLSLD
jgi:hypothetical protein